MAQAYEDDLRRKLLEARADAGLKKLAARFGVSYSWAQKVLRQGKQTGRAERVRPRPSRMNEEIAAYLRAQVDARSDLTLAELQQRLVSEKGIRFSIGRLWALLRQLELRLKRSLHAAERDIEASRERRRACLETIRSLSPEWLICMDESGVTTSMTRLYERSLGGARLHEATPAGHGKILTLLGAMSPRGMVATMTLEQPTDADLSLAVPDRCLCPRLRQDDTMVRGNLTSHEACGSGSKPRARRCLTSRLTRRI